MPDKPTLDLLTATAGDLRQLLDAGEFCSVDLVRLYLDQIAKHNHQGLGLHAVISTAPADRALEEARLLDAERAAKGPRSRLHGIPIILKDLICTPSFGLGTTSGSLALKGLHASKDAPIAQRLREAGCIVIAKSNLSEWANMKGLGVTSGWSAVGGQTQSPYVKGGVDANHKWMGHSTSAGSSSGSAVATAAGFAPFAIGTEADGSIVQPAIRAALYSLKGTVGDVDMAGTQSGGAAWDSAGPMAKSTEDCIDIMEILLPGRDFHSHLARSWHEIRVAYLDYKTWQFPETVCDKIPEFDDQHEVEMIQAMEKIESLGAHVTYNASLMTLSAITDKYNTVTMGQISRHQLRFTIQRFLALFDNAGMRTLHDLVQFNKEHAAEELPPEQPSQQVLKNGLADDMTDEEYDRGLQHLRQSVRHAVEQALATSNADVIMSSGETLLPSIAAAAGYPIGSVPLGYSTYNGRPFGMEIMARNGQEEEILGVMSMWEATFPDAREPPPLLVNWSANL